MLVFPVENLVNITWFIEYANRYAPYQNFKKFLHKVKSGRSVYKTVVDFAKSQTN